MQEEEEEMEKQIFVRGYRIHSQAEPSEAFLPRSPSSPLSPRAGADATGGPAVGLGPGAGLGKATSGPLELSSRWAPAESHRCNVTWGAH